MAYVQQWWTGPAATVIAAVAALDFENVVGIIGPATYGVTAWVTIRTTNPVALPDGLSVTVLDTSVAILGDFVGDPPLTN